MNKKQKVTALAFCISLLMIATLNGQQTVSYESALLTVVNDTIVAAEAPGIVNEIAAKAGADVESGQIVVALNQSEFKAEFEVAKMRKLIAELEASNDVDIRFAKKSIAVNRKLFERSANARSQYTKSISKSDLDRLKLELEQSILSSEQATLQAKVAGRQVLLEKENAAVAEVRLENRSIRSPLKGKVEQIFVQKGEWANAGQPIVRIVDPTRLRVKAIFDTEYFRRIRLGNQATFTYSNDGDEFDVVAKVSFVSSVIQNGKFQAWVDISNDDLELIPGVKGTLTVELTEKVKLPEKSK